MAAAVPITDITPVQPFDCGDTTGIAARWKRWLRAFDLYADGKGIMDKNQRKALLLHSAGLQVQDIFFTLTEEDGDDACDKVKKTLEKYFKPKTNVPFKRHAFQQMTQKSDETIDQFIVRLRMILC